MNKPLVTIITVCFNAIDTIEQTILSVVNQTYPNLEYIIVDGASTDGTVDLIKKYQDKITLFISEPDAGVYDAMNKGILRSKGEWVNFMNSGDTFVDNNVIEKVFTQNISNEVMVLYGDVIRCFPGYGEIVQRFNNLKVGSIQYNINHQSTFTNGNLIRKIKYDLRYRIAADAKFFNEVYKRGGVFLYVPVLISNYEAANGISAKQLKARYKEYSEIQGIGEYSRKWIWGYLKIVVQIGLKHLLPESIYNKFIYSYVNNIAVKKTSM